MPIKSHVIPPTSISVPQVISTVASSFSETHSWGLGIGVGGSVVTGTKLPPLLPLTENLIPIYVVVLCKTWPTSGNLVFDILFRPLGSTTRTTVSDGTFFTVPNSTDTVVLTNLDFTTILTELGELTLDVISAGASANVTVRMKCKRHQMPSGPGYSSTAILDFSSVQSSYTIATVA